MKQVARGLAGYGRNGDNNLVHVSDQELRGIEQLTGRKFTRNPDTGLPEAFNFSSLIPVVAGIAGTVLSGGNPIVGAAASGLASAGVAKASGGSTEDALTKGLISGVTSYAGSSLLSGVGEAAGAGLADGGTKVATEGAAQGATQAATQGAGGLTSGGVGEAISGMPNLGSTIPSGGVAVNNAALSSATPAATQGIGSISQNAIDSAGSIKAAEAITAANPGAIAGSSSTPLTAQPGIINTMSTRASEFGARASNIVNNPGTSLSQIGTNIVKNPIPAGIAAMGTYASMSDMGGNRPRMPGTDTYDPNKYPEQFPTNPRRYVAPPSGYRAGIDPEYRYFAKGGLASMRQEGGMTENVVNEAKAALLGEHPKPQDALSRFEGMFGGDALALLRDRITGGRVKGAGGGMDDLIPGTIEGRQKVRLADGEFVIPSDVVSGIGDGSTDQGVRRLHEMMNRVRKERTGKTAQPKAIGGKISL